MKNTKEPTVSIDVKAASIFLHGKVKFSDLPPAHARRRVNTAIRCVQMQKKKPAGTANTDEPIRN